MNSVEITNLALKRMGDPSFDLAGKPAYVGYVDGPALILGAINEAEALLDENRLPIWSKPIQLPKILKQYEGYVASRSEITTGYDLRSRFPLWEVGIEKRDWYQVEYLGEEIIRVRKQL